MLEYKYNQQNRNQMVVSDIIFTQLVFSVVFFVQRLIEMCV